MKNIIFKTSFLAVLFSAMSCQDKLDTPSGNEASAIYMPEQTATINIASSTVGGQTDVEVRLAKRNDEDVKATISMDDFFAAYNKKNNTRYKVLPASEYKIYQVGDPSNVMKDGKIVVNIKKKEAAAKIRVVVNPLSDETYPIGIKYAIPLRITSAGVSRILENDRAVVSFNRPFKTSVGEIKKGNNFSVALDPTIPTTAEFTIQGHFVFSNFDNTGMGHYWNQSMINFRGGPGSNWWYTRVNKGSFQVKDLDADGDATEIKMDVKTGTWYQVSYVYKDNNLKVYINGKLAKTFVRPNLSFVKGEGGAITVGNAGNDDSRDYRIREVRVWNRALTEAEINDNLYLPVDPDAEGLLVYLPIDKKNGFKELTKYNNKVTFGKSGHDPKTQPPVQESDISVEWTKNVKFPSDTFTTTTD